MEKDWYKRMAFYQIWIRSFYDGNGDGIGDLYGVYEKLPYIKSLGVDGIWFSPLYPSPNADYGYDISDYKNIHPDYGDLEQFQKVLDKAHSLGLRVIMDLVVNHTSDEHPWFLESKKSRDNPYSDYYIWRDGKNGKLPNNWDSLFEGKAWEYCPERDQYYLHIFAKKQPDLNMDNPKVREEVKSIMRFWLDMGCDGFRVDMAGSLVKNDQEGKGTIRLWQQVRKFLDAEFPDAAMVSEWGEPDKSLQGGFHMDFLLHFGPSHYNDLFRCDEPFFSKRGKGDISEFVETYKTNYNKTAQKGLICIPSGNHDMDRLARRLQGDELKIAFAFLLSMPGAPFIYYGDEIGMRYVEGLKSVEGGYNRTGSRSPMQWDDSTNAGFSSAPASDLYITMDPGKDRPTAKAQMADPDSLYHEVKKLIQIRQSSKALLSRGTIEFVYAEKNQYPLAYVREAEGEKVLVIINPSDKEQSFPYSAELKDALYTIGGKAESKDGTITIPAQSAGFYHI